MKLYIAGPMRGIRHYNFPAFDEAASCLVAEGGYDVVSPAQYDREHGFDPVRDDLTGDEDLAELDFDLKAALAHDLDVVCTEVDGVALLDGWEHSSGARAEVATALALGKPVKPWRCWDNTRTCHRHLITELPQRARAAEQATWHYGFEQASSLARHDAHPDSTRGRLARERERGVPAGHVHFATEHPVKGCKACLDDVARAALDGDFDKIDWTSPPDRLGAPVRDGQPERVRAHSDADSAQEGESHGIDLHAPGECVDCDEQRRVVDVLAAEAKAIADAGAVAAPADEYDVHPGTSTLRRGEELRVTSSTGGAKGMKLAQLGAIDPQALLTLAEVAGFGAQKYARNNYLLGYDWSLAFDALLRHALRFWGGEDIDPESGQPHMAHCAWLSLALVSFMQRGLGTDDRFRQDAS